MYRSTLVTVATGDASDDDHLECLPIPLPFRLSTNLGKKRGF